MPKDREPNEDELLKAVWSEDRCTAGDGKCGYVIRNLADYEKHLERVHPNEGSAKS